MSRRLSTRGWLVVGAATGGVLVVVIWLCIEHVDSLSAVETVRVEVRDLWSTEVVAQHLARFWADLGSPYVAALTVSIAAIVVAVNVGWPSGFLVVAAAAAAGLAEALKHLFGPTRMEVDLLGAGAAGTYPSGHVAYGTAVFGLLAVLGWMHGHREIAAVMMLLVVGMGPAMTMVSAHQVSDVAGGYALGFAWLCAVLAAGRSATVHGKRPWQAATDSGRRRDP